MQLCSLRIRKKYNKRLSGLEGEEGWPNSESTILVPMCPHVAETFVVYSSNYNPRQNQLRLFLFVSMFWTITVTVTVFTRNISLFRKKYK